MANEFVSAQKVANDVARQFLDDKGIGEGTPEYDYYASIVDEFCMDLFGVKPNYTDKESEDEC